MTLSLLLALLTAAPGAPPGLCWAAGSWPVQREGRGAPASVRTQVEPAISGALPPEERACFLYAFEDLDGDGVDELLVYVETFGWCGTAGCPLYVMRWSGKRLAPLSRTQWVRNVFLQPRSAPGLRPLLVEKWGVVFRRVTARHGRYPRIVDEERSIKLEQLPKDAREVPWIEADNCATEEDVPSGIRCSE